MIKFIKVSRCISADFIIFALMITRVIIYLFVFFVATINGQAQNLVYNGSFEIRDSVFEQSMLVWSDCPWSDDNPNHPQLPKAKGWMNPQGLYNNILSTGSTADFFHKCNCDTNQVPSMYAGFVGVPKNYWFGYQYPRTGDGYGGIVYYGWNDIHHIAGGERIQTKLISQLKQDNLYKMVYYLCKAENGSLSIESQGAYFSTNKMDVPGIYNGVFNNQLTPQVINTNGYITDTLNWTKMEGIFTANGGEQYLTIGNFLLDSGIAHYEHPAPFWYWALYYIDDISVYPVNAPVCSANTGNDTLICQGNEIVLGKTNVPAQYKSEYTFQWYYPNKENDIISTEEQYIVSPDTTTTYILKVMDFKFDVSWDTITVTVVDCSEPTNLIVFPNPTSNTVNFRFNSPIPNNMYIELYDIPGRRIKSVKYKQNFDLKEVQMNLFELAKGMYFYSVIINGKNRFAGKIIKMDI